MSKRKGLGRNVNRSVEIMDTLQDALKKFGGMPLKQGLKENKAFDEDAQKLLSDASEKAHALTLAVDKVKDLVEAVEAAEGRNPRFESRQANVARRVVQRYIESA